MSPKKPAPKEQLKLKGQVAIVTGAASGIGRGIAIRFAREGVKVAIVDINREGAQKVASEIQKAGGKAIAIKADVGKLEQVNQAVRKTVDELGQLNVVVNVAGINIHSNILENEATKKWRKVIQTNLFGAFYLSHVAARVMIKNGWSGNFINITSVHSEIPVTNGLHYPVAKGGLRELTKSLALELAPYGIRVNAIAPGAIRNTRMNKDVNDENDKKEAGKLNIPLGRYGLPEEIADVAVFLASEKASYITGQEIFVDGGFTLVR